MLKKQKLKKIRNFLLYYILMYRRKRRMKGKKGNERKGSIGQYLFKALVQIYTFLWIVNSNFSS